MLFQLLAVLVTKPNAAKMLAKQLGWQEALVRLLILRPRPKSKRGSTINYGDVSSSANQVPSDKLPSSSSTNNNRPKEEVDSANENIPSSQSSNQNASNSVISRPSDLPGGLVPPAVSSLNPGSSGGNTPYTPVGSGTPQFTKKGLFHDPTEGDLASLCRDDTPDGASNQDGSSATGSIASADDLASSMLFTICYSGNVVLFLSTKTPVFKQC